MDTIIITDKDNNKKEMEVTMTFNLHGYEDTYIIYNEIDKSHYYLGKYKEFSTKMNNNFTPEEYALCEKIFERVVKKNAWSKPTYKY